MTIDEAEQKIAEITDQYFCLFKWSNEVGLDGGFTSEELRKIADILEQIGEEDEV